MSAYLIIAVHDGTQYLLELKEKTVDSLLSKAVIRLRALFFIKSTPQRDIFGFQGMPPLGNGLIKYKDAQVEPDSLQELLSRPTTEEIVLHFISKPLSLPPPSVGTVNNSNPPEEQDRPTQAVPTVHENYSAMFSYQ